MSRKSCSSFFLWRDGVVMLVLVAVCSVPVWADWSTYRFDNARSGYGRESVVPPLSLKWTFEPTHKPRPVWPDPSEELPRAHQDNALHATIADGMVYFGDSVENLVYAVKLTTGEMLWSVYAEGPVRYAPTIADGRVYFGSDDGYVYCLNAQDGSLVWKYRSGFSDEKVIGNQRMISMWPVRTSVVVDRGQVLFCAGVFPFEGIQICALNVADGSVVWKNDTVGDRAHELQYGGISPQGYLVASRDVLYVPSGRAMPAAFDRKTGELMFYASPGAKRGGTWALLDKDKLIAGVDLSGRPDKVAYDAKKGRLEGEVYAWYPGIDMVVTPKVTYILTKDGVYALDRKAYAIAERTAEKAAAQRKIVDGRISELRKKRREAQAREIKQIDEQLAPLMAKTKQLGQEIFKARGSSYAWRWKCQDMKTLILAGDVVYVGGEGVAVGLNAVDGAELWRQPFEGNVCSFAASDQHLIVSTDKGPVYCFGKGDAVAKTIKIKINPEPFVQDEFTEKYQAAAKKIIELAGITKGYCLVVDCGEGRLAYELAKISELSIIGIEKSSAKIAQARKQLMTAGFLGKRIVVENWDLDSLPPYFANLIVSEAILNGGKSAATQEQLEYLLRPSGGTMVAGFPDKDGQMVWRRFVRPELEGAGKWTQLYGNPQNTACSEDELVKGPFGLLWYGEPGPQNLVERHGRGISPLSMDGRVFQQGEEVVMAYDAYNGTFLWEKKIPGAVRVRVDVDGGNLALTKDGLYIAAYDKCYRLDPASGETVRIYNLPASPDGSARRWGYITVIDGVLYGVAAMPLRNEYAAVWKDFVDEQEQCWRPEEELSEEIFEVRRQNLSYNSIYNNYKQKFPEPGEDLYMDLHRDGTLWRIMADFPAWDSQRTAKGTLTNRVMGGDTIFAVDVATGETLWQYRGKRIPNISVSIVDGKVFFVEETLTPQQKEAAWQHKQQLVDQGIYEVGTEVKVIKTSDEADIRLAVSLDAATGEALWQKPLEFTGCGGDKMGSAYKDGVLLFFGQFSNHDTGFFLKNELTWRRITALDGSSGEVVWSRPLNYLRRPLIVGDTVIIEPRACELKTGKIKTRPHPITSQPVPWEFLRPGHCCAISSASAHTLFYRSYWAAIYDLTDDKGISLFGAIRPGCWLNMISANGLMLMPEASSGCTCSFPIRCSMALVPKPKKITSNWTVFVTHGAQTPVKHLAVNFGAPGDMRDSDGKLWFAYPRPKAVSAIGYGRYGVQFDLGDKLAAHAGYFQRDYRGVEIEGTDKPWLYTSGCRGLLRCELPLIDDNASQEPGVFTLRLGFVAGANEQPGDRVFDVKAQGKTILRDFDIIAQAGAVNKSLVKEIRDIKVENVLILEFLSKNPEAATDQAPVINFLEVIRQDGREAASATGTNSEDFISGRSTPEVLGKAQ
ncbi:MAG: PQQ-binding-like beta-propeller repeat protein [Sedimentisphaerales bacterium]|nr:PQQ-binding-like beta-propeller repeat protein [Sedimentisphaerales bacterium]